MLERTLNGSFGFTSQGALVANFPPAVIGPFGEIGRQTKDPVLTQEVARHRNLETTQGTSMPVATGVMPLSLGWGAR